MTAPMLPCICPPSDLENNHSLGSILAAPHVTEPLVNRITSYNVCYTKLLRMTKNIEVSETNNLFTDIDGHWAEQNILYLVEQKIIVADDRNNFV